MPRPKLHQDSTPPCFNKPMARWFDSFGLEQRRLIGELMDDPNLDPARHEAALTGLARLNAVAGSARLLWPAVREAARDGPVRLLDVATGAGDLPVRLARRARHEGLPVSVAGCDLSPRAIARARAAARAAGVDVEFFVVDILRGPLPEKYDVIACSLFLHHLTEDDTATLLGRLAGAARRTLVVADLERSAPGLFLAWTASRLGTTSDVVRTDAVRSVRAAYTTGELRTLADRAGLADAAIVRRWPCRLVLRWDRPR